MDTPQHSRRPRYGGTHPKHFSDKYKELQPEKYAETVAHIVKKGNTPAGMHLSICVQEILAVLRIKPGERGLDATLGYGGHSREMLARLEGRGHLTGLDVDALELGKTRQRLVSLGFGENIFTARQMNFANIDAVSAEDGPFDFILADLGISSMQVDNPARGFSYKTEGPLDLRLNPEAGLTAAERLKTIAQEELEGMLLENADEPYAAEIAAAIVSALRRSKPIDTTTQLRTLIENALQFIPLSERRDAIKKSCQRTFQALRIDVNREFEVLFQLLEKLPQALASGGRVAILSFHSGEDRLVKKSFKALLQAGIYSAISEEVIRPSAAECAANHRARSAKLRWAVRA